MAAFMFLGGDPTKVDVSGYTFGDILAADVTGTLEPVTVGADTFVLTADSVAPEGVDYQAGGGGGGGTPSNTVVTETAFGQASTAGAATAYSRGDHTHGTPASPTVPGPAATVVTETSFGQASAVGTGTTYARNDHTHGTPATPSSSTVEVATTGFITSGNITVNTAAFQVGTDLTVPAAAGHILEVAIEVLCADTGADVQFDAATRVAGADVNFFSTGTGVTRFPGGIGNWYVQTGRFTSPGLVRYTVQAGDVSGGNVTVRLYGQVPAGSRVLFANATYPLRIWLTNYGAG